MGEFLAKAARSDAENSGNTAGSAAEATADAAHTTDCVAAATHTTNCAGAIAHTTDYAAAVAAARRRATRGCHSFSKCLQNASTKGSGFRV